MTTETLRSEKKSWHFSVEKDFITSTKLSAMARMLYVVMESYASPSRPVPFPGMLTLARILGCTKNTVLKYRNELEAKKWLRVERHRRNDRNKFYNNAYVLLDGPKTGSKDFSSKTVTAKKVNKINGVVRDQFLRAENLRAENLTTKSVPVGTRVPNGNKSGCSVPRSGTEVPLTTPTTMDRAAHGGVGVGVVAPSAASADADAEGSVGDEEESWEMAEKAQELMNLWNESYQLVYQRTSKHTQDDLYAFEHLCTEEKDIKTVMGLILMAWSMQHLSNQKHNPHFYCNKYSRKPADLCRTLDGHDRDNLDHIRIELGWMARKSEVEAGYAWLERFRTLRQQEAELQKMGS